MRNCCFLILSIILLLTILPLPLTAQPGGPGDPPAALVEAYGDAAPGGFKPPQVMAPAGLPGPQVVPQPAAAALPQAEISGPAGFENPNAIQVAQTPEEFAATAAGFEQSGQFAEALEARLALEGMQPDNLDNRFGLIRCLDQLGRSGESSARMADLLPVLPDPRERWMLDEILWHQLLSLAASPDQLAWTDRLAPALETLQTIIQSARVEVPAEEATADTVADLFSQEAPAAPQIPDVSAEIDLSTALLSRQIQAIPDRPVPGLTTGNTNDPLLLQQAVNQLPVHAGARLDLAGLLRDENPETAEKLYLEVLTLRPLDPRPMMRLAEMDTARGDFAIARDRVRQVLGLQPEHPDALAFIALLDRLEEEMASGVNQGLPRDGFVPSEKLLVKDDGSAELREETWLRQANDSASRRLHKFAAGTQMRVLAHVDGWVHVLEVTTMSLLDDLIKSR